MARYKPTKSITLNQENYPGAVANINKIAKEQDRPVHEIADVILRDYPEDTSEAEK